MIGPPDQRCVCPEVTGEHDPLQTEFGNTPLPGAIVETNIRISKSIDRLHGIADGEERVTVARHPAAQQLLEQLRSRLLKAIL